MVEWAGSWGHAARRRAYYPPRRDAERRATKNLAVASPHAAGSGSFGGAVLTSAGATDIIVAKYDSSGNHLWSKLFGDPATQGVKGLAIDSQGNLVLTGLLFGPTDFGGGPIIAGGGEDTFIAKLSP